VRFLVEKFRIGTGFSSSTSVSPVRIILLIFHTDFPRHSTRYQWEMRAGNGTFTRSNVLGEFDRNMTSNF
jgi:hypothetical protein